MNNIPHYENFKVAIYARVYEVQQMSDLNYLASNFEVMRRRLKIDKVYLETHRDLVVAEETTLLQARQYLESRGVQVSGGITITVNERNRFETYCYTNPAHRQKLKEVAAYTARLFDGPNFWIPEDEESFSPHGYVVLDFDDDTVWETYRVPNNIGVLKAQL